MSQIRRLLTFVLAYVMLITLIPIAAFADDSKVVYLTIENTTFSCEDGAAWDGKLLDNMPIEITEGDSKVVDVIVRGLEESGYSQNGADMGYISEINGLSEFDGGFSGGWMVTLNDWFISAGVSEFYVSDGDSVSVMYTSEGFGEDLGGSWSNNNKEIADILFSTGELDKEFSPDVYEYVLKIPAETESVRITPTAANKNFQTRIYLNTEFDDGDVGKYIEGEEEFESVLCGLSPWCDIPENIGLFKRTQEIALQDGDVIAVACGLPYWSSMNGGEFGSGAENEPGKVYSFNVETEKTEIAVDAGIYDYTALTYKENNSECDAAVSESGVVFEVQNFSVSEDATVIDAVTAILVNAQIEYTLDGSNSYLTCIGGLSETDCGEESGWMISVNDKFLEVSAAEATLKDGDVIKLHYSVEGWGSDIGNYFTGGPVVKTLTIGGVETVISSNIVYEDENDYTGTVTYYLGEYTQGGENTPLEGDGSIETPFIIPVTVGAQIDITALTATIRTSLHENYLFITQGEGLSNILSENNYENDITFGIETMGSFKRNYYTVKLIRETVSDNDDDSEVDGEEDDFTEDTLPDNTPTNSASSGGGSSAKKEVKEELKEETNEEIKMRFNDIKGHWAENYIKRLANDNIITGKSDECFAPDDAITRAELVTLLYRLSNDTWVESVDVFTDVNENDWYASAISWAKVKGIANGINENEFKPDGLVNREQSAVFIVRFCELMEYEFESGEDVHFNDETRFAPWSRESIAKAQKYGIINGFENGNFSPNAETTRAQIAKMLCNMIDGNIAKD